MFLFYVFFNLIFKVQSYAIWGLSFLLIIIELCSKKKIYITKNDIFFLILPIIFLLASFYSPYFGSPLKFSFTFLLMTLILIILSKECTNNIDYNFIFYIILLFSGVHVFATIFYQLFPSMWQNILPYFLKGSDLRQNIITFNYNHINCGLSPVQSANAMYITAFITCCFSGALKYGKKYYLLLILGGIALMLSGKRGILLAVIFAFIIYYLFFKYKSTGKISYTFIKLIFLIFIVGLIGYFVAKNFFPDAFRIIARFTNQKDITTGRGEYYKILLNSYLNGNFIFGNGLFFSRYKLFSVYGEANDAHNIYIQLLVETGIFGLFGFLCIVFNIIKKLIKEIDYKNIITMMSFFYTIVFLIYGMSGNDLFDLSILPFWYFLISFLFIRKDRVNL